MTIQKYFESQKWTFAKTYAMFAPHEYIVRSKVSDKEAFDKAVDFIQKYGMRMFYYKHERKYLFAGGQFYWVIRDSEDDPTAVINRCRPDDYDIVFMKRGTQAKKIAEDEAKKKPKYEQMELSLQ